ncbi:MAG: ACP S-malonyltransferase [Anaerolineae bacterium]|nr:ACP S-malonyltransferase [Anaerolineae bacterium]
MNLSEINFSIVFPGQGSQEVGMGKDLSQKYPSAKQTYQEADEILGVPLSKISWEGPVDELNDTINTQPALFIHSIAAYRVFQELHPEAQPTFFAGHSLGELSALTAAGAISFEEGMKLVRTRGALMKKAGEVSPGGMAAILGLDIPVVEDICLKASQGEESVQIANDNCPGQVVISGASQAVERALPMAQEAGAKRAMPLAVSIAAHSELMLHAQEEFIQAVKSTNISVPRIPVIGNVSAKPLAAIADIQADLQAQLSSRVRWTESVEYMISGGSTTFLEIGTGNVLSGLIRRINRDAERIPLGTPENFETFQQ